MSEALRGYVLVVARTIPFLRPRQDEATVKKYGRTESEGDQDPDCHAVHESFQTAKPIRM